MKKLRIALLCLALSAFATACGTLAPGGAYTDKTLYDADLTITASYDVLHSFVLYEYQNRHDLAATPEVKKLADNVRANAPTWFRSAFALRDAYASNPTAENRDALTQALGVIRAAVRESMKYLAAIEFKPEA